jgi:hypothetical protein
MISKSRLKLCSNGLPREESRSFRRVTYSIMDSITLVSLYSERPDFFMQISSYFKVFVSSLACMILGMTIELKLQLRFNDQLNAAK